MRFRELEGATRHGRRRVRRERPGDIGLHRTKLRALWFLYRCVRRSPLAGAQRSGRSHCVSVQPRGRSATERDQYVTRCQCLPPAGLLEERLQRVEVIVVGGRRRGRCGRRGRRSRRRSLGRWWWCGRLWWRWRRWGRDGARRRRGGCRRRRALRRSSPRVPALVVVVLDWDDDLLDLVIKVLIFLKRLDGTCDGMGKAMGEQVR